MAAPAGGPRHVVLVRSNLADRDIRSPKEITALISAGYRVTLLSWDRECSDNAASPAGGYREIRFRFRAPWGVWVLPFLIVWWAFVVARLLFLRWDAVHAINFDNAIPAVIAARLKGKRAIYEILDVYEEGLHLPRPVRNLAMSVDKLFMRCSDAVVVADIAQAEGIGGVPNRRVVPVYDSPPDPIGAVPDDCPRPDVFTVFYAGVFSRVKRQNLDTVIEAVKGIEGVKLVVAGYGDLADEIAAAAREMPETLAFIGKISYEEVLKRGCESHLFFSLRDPSVPTNRYTCGSTLFNAMSVGRPLLVNAGTSTTAKVVEEQCGFVVDPVDVVSVREAIIRLKDDPELVRQLGANARTAYERTYCWEKQAQVLVGLYDSLWKNDRKKQ